MDIIWRNVYSENVQAKEFYERFGFKNNATTLFQMEAEIPLDKVTTVKII